MSVPGTPPPGWYPDPADPASGRLRHWDGAAWGQDTRGGQGTPGGGSSGGWGRRVPWLVAVIAVLVVAAVAVVLIGRGRGAPDVEDTNTAAPTGTPWDEMSTPAPSSPDSSSATPGGPCLTVMTTTDATPASGEPLTAGALTMPAPDGWSGPIRESRVPNSDTGWAYYTRLGIDMPGWVAQQTVGTMRPESFTTTEQTALDILTCLPGSAMYRSVTATVTEQQATSISIDGVPASQVDATLAIESDRLATEASAIRIIVVEADDTASFYLSAIPVERPDLQAIADRTAGALSIAG
ncbi:MAG: DUF2510 domain-containing protein [Propionibacteriaceae bacterium]|uniref:DUF2510 domain-containing protein n=1 Tax=Propionibacterium ruminifibrarum TaxID=1962131 RepID=A0A375I2U3_9ACTN|nr:DUF2510 domain-containing protein [Propionibacterium ruminifibrarum]MBE6478307.1 DUF2510 domain-containing protein [Propionibacteriaceae bacterium]SPF67716.1 Domain of unknown function DUF2510 [Propionibacterium ruminifibrarum]